MAAKGDFANNHWNRTWLIEIYTGRVELLREFNSFFNLTNEREFNEKISIIRNYGSRV
ncbi:hypothetical protein GCM10022297_13820 [Lactobacillus hamsteri]